MNYINPSVDVEKIGPPSPHDDPLASHAGLHRNSLENAKGRLALQTAAIVGASAAVAAARTAGHSTAPVHVRR